jgi:hypothetical protein
LSGLSVTLSIEWQRAQLVRAMVKPRCALGDKTCALADVQSRARVAASAPTRTVLLVTPDTVLLLDPVAAVVGPHQRSAKRQEREYDPAEDDDRGDI